MAQLKKTAYENSWIYYFMIALFGMNFLGRGSIFCLIFAVFAFLKMPKKIFMDGCALCVFLFTIFAFVASIMYYSKTEAIKCFNFFLMYFVGLNGYRASVDKEKYIKRTIFSLFIGYALLVTITYFINLNEKSIQGKRFVLDFWTGEYVAATLIGLLSSVVIGYFFYAIVCQKKASLKWLCVFFVIIVFLVNIQTATRTPIVLFFVIMPLMSVLYIVNQKRNKAFKSFMIFVVILISIAVLYNIDTFGVRTYIESTSLFERFLEEGVESARLEIGRDHFKYMFDYLFGGNNIQKITGHVAHNFLQQGHDLYGIFATLTLIVIFLYFIKNLLVLLLKNKKNDIDYLLISLYISMLLQSFLEPVFTGYPCFVFSLLFIQGITTGYLKNQENA